MSNDLRTRVAEALCENAGLSWHTTWSSLREGFREEADAVLCVLDDEREKLRDILRSEKERADAAIKREETAEEHATELGQYARRMEQERDAAKSASDAWKELAERNDETSGPLRANLRRAERERDAAQREGRAWRDEVRRLRDLVDEQGDSDDVDELKATIVSQAREIARLKGESA
jgi:hypothetical protein